MKVVHITTIDLGGAYKAAVRISNSMQEYGNKSDILLRTKVNRKSIGIECFHTIWEKNISKAKNVINVCLSSKEITTEYFGTDVTKKEIIKNADVIVLHWINSFLSYRVLDKIFRLNKPIIWVMHDMWLFTGGCHCDGYCGKYSEFCGKCHLLGSKKENDLSKINYIYKQKLIENSNVTLISPSKWIAECAKKSNIAKASTIKVIPNPIDVEMFYPYKEDEKNLLKIKFGISESKQVILYGAMGALEDTNKGYQYLKDSLKYLDPEKYMLLIYGNSVEDLEVSSYIETKYFGYIYNEKDIVDLYNISDVFICPSKQENYPNSVLEAQACNVPVVAFRIGGIPDIVKHLKTGYLCEYENTKEIAEGIVYCTTSSLASDCYISNEIVKNNSFKVIGKQYQELITKLCV